MSNKPVKGLRVGNYRITPLGLCTLAVLVLAIAAAIIIPVFHPFDTADRTVVAINATLAPIAQPAEEDSEDEEGPVVTPTPSPTPEPQLRVATIRSLGEIAMQQNLLYSVVDGNEFNFFEMFSEIAPVMADADYTVADVEGTLGGTVSTSGSNAMNTPPSLIGTLQDCGVDMLMLANDHALDGGFQELQATVQNCVDAGMGYVGAALSAEEKAQPKIVSINGIKVAFLAYTETLNGNEKKADAAATDYGVNLISKSNAVTDIAAAREAGADIVVCYVSWGEMLNQKITESQQKIAKILNKAGVDVIIGYNPHVVQPASWLESTDSDGTVRRTLCLGATGNFLSDSRSQYSDSGVIFQFTIEETEFGKFAITSPVYIPTYVWRSGEEGGKYTYRTLAVGQWLEDQPEDMAYSDVQRMRQVWAEIQNIMGTEVATVAAE